MRHSKALLSQIRELNREVNRYANPSTPEETRKRDELLEALAWHVHKLQLRVLPGGMRLA